MPVWLWAVVIVVLATALLWIGLVLRDASLGKRAPALLAVARDLIAQRRWPEAAGKLAAALPLVIGRAQAPIAREVLLLAGEIDRALSGPSSLEGRLAEVSGLALALEKVEREGGKVAAESQAPLERFLYRTSTGQNRSAFERVERAPPLVRAVFDRDLAALQSLLESGADPNAVDAVGCSAVSHAVAAGQLAAARLLLGAGARLGVEQHDKLFCEVTLLGSGMGLEDGVWLLGWLADQGFDPRTENHVTTQTGLDWADSVGAGELARRLRSAWPEDAED